MAGFLFLIRLWGLGGYGSDQGYPGQDLDRPFEFRTDRSLGVNCDQGLGALDEVNPCMAVQRKGTLMCSYSLPRLALGQEQLHWTSNSSKPQGPTTLRDQRPWPLSRKHSKANDKRDTGLDYRTASGWGGWG